jgi:putative ABC transport system permease protein
MLARRLSREPARAVGTIMTLSFGLCSFIAIHIWGGTLMSSYVPSPEWPDAIVSALPGGLTKEQVEQGNKATGLGRNLIPIECTQFPLDKSTCKKIEANGGSSDGQVLIFGVDPQKAFGENKPFANFKFSNGNAALAAIELTKGDTCIVPDMFLRLTGLKVNDTISLAGKELRICGSVNLNWHLVTSRAQVRTLNGRLDKKEKSQKSAASPKSKRTMGMIFTSENTARELTGNFDRINFLWAELSEELKSIHPLQATVRLDEALRGTMKPSNESVLKVHHRDEIADGTVAHGNDIIGTMARIPFWSLIVTSAGIIALLIASPKASQKELRTMRAVGMTQRQVMRLFAGEAMLIIICMLIISFFGGMLIGWSFTACTRLAMRAGLAVTLVIPWLTVLKGICFATLLCIIMSALPLRSIAK